MNLKNLNYVFFALILCLFASCGGGSVDDATLKTSSTVKGKAVLDLGTPSAVLADVVAGSVEIAALKAADTSNTGKAITLFSSTNSAAAIKVVRYPEGSDTSGFAGTTAYANQALLDFDFFIIRVTAEDATTVLYYKIVVTVAPTVAIGESYKGGKVGYILKSTDSGYVEDEQHGLIVSMIDQSTGIRWYNGGYTTTGATAVAVGTGQANTSAILDNQAAGSYAASSCDDLVIGAYSDWFLPSKDELYQLYVNKNEIAGDFVNNYYWSSSESDVNYAWGLSFYDGTQSDANSKSNTLYVRCVRSF